MSGGMWSKLKFGAAAALVLIFTTACAGSKPPVPAADGMGPPPEPGDKTHEVDQTQDEEKKPGPHDLYEPEVDGFGPPTVPTKKNSQVEDDETKIETEAEADEYLDFHAE